MSAINTQSWQLDRRHFLRGMGVSLALPLLDVMIPAGRLAAAEAGEPVRRFVCMANPFGMIADAFFPAEAGPDSRAAGESETVGTAAGQIHRLFEPRSWHRRRACRHARLSVRRASDRSGGHAQRQHHARSVPGRTGGRANPVPGLEHFGRQWRRGRRRTVPVLDALGSVGTGDATGEPGVSDAVRRRSARASRSGDRPGMAGRARFSTPSPTRPKRSTDAWASATGRSSINTSRRFAKSNRRSSRSSAGCRTRGRKSR